MRPGVVNAGIQSVMRSSVYAVQGASGVLVLQKVLDAFGEAVGA